METKKFILCLMGWMLASLMGAHSINAANYYVATTGSDTNAGTAAAPFKTVQKGVNTANAGDTIYIGSGTYTENVTLSKTGSSGSPITIRPDGNATAIINGGSGTPMRAAADVGWWIIDGLSFTTTGSSSHGMLVTSGVWGGAVAHDWIVRNCKLAGGGILVRGYNNLIENNNIDGQHVNKSGDDYNSGIRETYGGDGGNSAAVNGTYTHHNTYRGNIIKGFSRGGIWSMGYTHDCVFENNTISDIYGTGTGPGQCLDTDGAGTVEWRHIIRGNNISGCGAEAIQMENTFDTLVENNFIHDTPARGITLINYGANVGCAAGGENGQYGDTNGDNSCVEADSRNIIRQNVVLNAGSKAFVNYSMDGVHYYNNSAYGGGAGMEFSATQYLKYSEAIGNIVNGAIVSGFKLAANNLTSTSSVYTNPPADLTLLAGGSAVNKMASLGSFSNSISGNWTTDFAGHPRLAGNAYDIGAYENQGGAVNPTNTPGATPTNIPVRTPTPAPTVPTGTGNIYYVSPNGNDNNPGSAGANWLTIQKAANTAMAGDTVYIHGGTYRQAISVKNSGNATQGYITFAGVLGEKAIIDGTGTTGDLFYLGSNSYIRVKDLNFQNAGHIGILGEGGHHILIQNNQIDRTSSSAIAFSFPLSNLSLKPHDFVIENNVISHGVMGTDAENISISGGYNFEIRNNDLSLNGLDGQGQKEGIDLKNGCYSALVHHNFVHDFNDVAIYIDAYDGDEHDIKIYSNKIKCNDTGTFGGFGIALSAEQANGVLENIFVYNNVVSSCTNGSGIAVTGWTTATPPDGQKKNIVIANNTVVGNGNNEPIYGGISVFNANISGPITIENNIVSGNSPTQININSGVASYVTSKNNLINGNNTSGCVNCVTANPGFVSNSDFHLMASSAAIDKGITATGFTDDFDGFSRPYGAGWDIGAFEFGGNSLISPTPIAILGDANGDGKTDDLDYLVWAKYYGLTNATGVAQGDFNTDRKVDDLDYVIWVNNYGK